MHLSAMRLLIVTQIGTALIGTGAIGGTSVSADDPAGETKARGPRDL